MVEGQSISLLSAQEVFSTLSMFMQRHSMLSRIIWFAVGNSGDSSMFLELSLATHGLYFQLLLLFVMLLCCYPCEHGSLPEQNAKRELAIPDVATTGSLLRCIISTVVLTSRNYWHVQSFDCIELASFDQILKIDIAILSENEIRFNFSESYKTSSCLHEIFNVQKNHDSLSEWLGPKAAAARACNE
ncbi:hypothetical protein T05_9590 [Trichinella murrelli]|uniref:Uncharacterized protein n=1 Tax=Trichinella murrelli TaxID=144512 RepID=A0A0V0U1S2_9BILA|nr:hypothetical protein T05_9590 [Trichinella murrelli]